MFLIKQPASRLALLAILITWAFGLPTSNAQTFALTDATALVPVNVKAAAAEYKGRKAVLITREAPKTRDEAKDGFALLKGVDFQDGTIEGEIALKITAPPGPPGMRRSPGFVGIAFRRGRTPHTTTSSTCGQVTQHRMINQCGIIPCSTATSPTRAG